MNVEKKLKSFVDHMSFSYILLFIEIYLTHIYNIKLRYFSFLYIFL